MTMSIKQLKLFKKKKYSCLQLYSRDLLLNYLKTCFKAKNLNLFVCCVKDFLKNSISRNQMPLYIVSRKCLPKLNPWMAKIRYTITLR